MANKPKQFYLSKPHPCGYFPDRQALTLLCDPGYPLDNPDYSRLVGHGFRRSGNLVYRPHCQDCLACIAVRVPVTQFRPNRNQRRIWKRNADLVATQTDSKFNDEYFALYCRYQHSRHRGGTMDTQDPEQYQQLMFGNVGDTWVYEFRESNKNKSDRHSLGTLRAVAIADRLENGLSAVYTFFDPEHEHRSLGVYTVLYEIEIAQSLGLAHVYLGYYIADSQKMNHKINYQPLEAFCNESWNPLHR